MPKLSRPTALPILLFGTIALISVACNNNNSTTSPSSNAQPTVTPATTPASTTPVAKPISLAAKTTTSAVPQSDTYEQALVKAASANSISQSASSQDDWQIVSNKWQQAIELLKAVPAASPKYAIAKTKLKEYQQYLDYAQSRANPGSKPVSAISKCTGKPQKSSTIAAGTVFRVPIKRREGGTVVVDVNFFSLGLKQTHEMILDTGASGTVITPVMASALRVKPIGFAKANTASGQGVVFGVGCIDSMEVGGASVRNIPVAIGSALDIGLLGQDFFGGYDITIRNNVVEFRQR
ncbi:retroviral-like aspartic protease family protein [Planktothrix sp. FACHB-1355]|uniref:Retroviral-like aspartic protease family protein n=1 Tax=Aerosakkonema funiforme FACHB-1375 TaxID=2949571 RepID=A0A926VCV5_9CYAN|nr:MULTISPECIES: retropepsin-like aspartic protease [Oscillatoriales]MBD2180209.1 retroviral-like aspartic protease family protein [Aerosakkonema funiforme FACHB-1375]MBD3558386.1 retroviral-like aspartic protease family protein [Planktothrix sp. FACHB-1355]